MRRQTLAQLEAELKQLEATDPAVKQAAEHLDTALSDHEKWRRAMIHAVYDGPPQEPRILTLADLRPVHIGKRVRFRTSTQQYTGILAKLDHWKKTGWVGIGFVADPYYVATGNAQYFSPGITCAVSEP